MSQGMGSPKAEKAAEKVRVLVRTEAPSPSKATAPRGSGWVIIPTMVARKIASNCHAFRETPDGTGRNHIMIPVAIEAISGFIAAPCHGWDAGATAAGVEEAARTVKAPRFPRELLESRVGLTNLASLDREDGMRMLVLTPLPKMAVLGRLGRREQRIWGFDSDFGRRDRREGRYEEVSAREAMNRQWSKAAAAAPSGRRFQRSSLGRKKSSGGRGDFKAKTDYWT